MCLCFAGLFPIENRFLFWISSLGDGDHNDGDHGGNDDDGDDGDGW